MRKETSSPSLARFFFETFLASLTVTGGGFAILLVLDDVFSRRRWFRKGELVERLALFQSVPGLIAGNLSIWAGMKLHGRVGAFAGLVATALPPFLVFLAASALYESLPLADARVAAFCAGLRAALAGVVAVALTKCLSGGFASRSGALVALVAAALVVGLGVNPALVVALAMAFGALRPGVSVAGRDPPVAAPPGPPERPASRRRTIALVALLAFVAAAAALEGPALCEFLGFGCICFGGGFTLVPVYEAEFVGPSAPLLQLPVREFADVMALSQATPGPVGVNAATFFGYRLGGVFGAFVATAALLAPSWFFMTAAVSGSSRRRNARRLAGAFASARAVVPALVLAALVSFTRLGLFRDGRFDPAAAFIAVATAFAVRSGKVPVMAAIHSGAVLKLALESLLTS